MPARRFATLIDGAFAIRKLGARLGRFPSAADIQAISASIARHDCVSGLSFLRNYFYHAWPAEDVLENPLSKQKIELANTRAHTDHRTLLKDLGTAPDFALRLGETSVPGWMIGRAAFTGLMKSPRVIQADDLVPAIQQKGVDLRIGLDIARLSLMRSVQAIVVVTGDSDLVPAFKRKLLEFRRTRSAGSRGAWQTISGIQRMIIRFKLSDVP
jgi:uncharacterized LabA/DUF88 family protein